MPITIQVTEELLNAAGQQKVFGGLTNTIIRINGAQGNSFALRHLIGNIITVPKESSFAAGKPEPFINVGLAVPVFSLVTLAQQQEFVTEMTDLIMEATGGKLERDRIYINMLYGDGFWGVGGVAYNNYMLQTEAMKHQPAA